VNELLNILAAVLVLIGVVRVWQWMIAAIDRLFKSNKVSKIQSENFDEQYERVSKRIKSRR
jgi:hypothetical protein